MITLKQAKKLQHGNILHHLREVSKDGTPARVRVSGKVQLWKTRPLDFVIPVKYGLRDSFYIGNVEEYKNRRVEPASNWKVSQ